MYTIEKNLIYLRNMNFKIRLLFYIKGTCTNYILSGKGVSEMSTLFNNTYIVKMSTKGDEGCLSTVRGLFKINGL